MAKAVNTSMPPFTPEALALLFARENFRAFQKAGFLSHYWAPLISVCSGTTRDEIFLLTANDVRQRHGLWIMHVAARAPWNGRPGTVARDIPVHPMLSTLGFVEFVRQRQRTHPAERLFPEYKAMQGQAGMLFSRVFTQWINATVRRLPAEQHDLFAADFHFPSLRALFTVEAVRSGMSDHLLRALRGIGDGVHEFAEAAGDRAVLEKLAAAMERVDIASAFPPLYPYWELMA